MQNKKRIHVLILLSILILAGALRLVKLDQVPPGLHVDEAANTWNAYTILKTGKDQHGVSWPIFYTRAFGENRSTFYIYALIPFQGVWGMNVWTTRLPAAVGGVITVLLIYFVGARLFDRPTGLVSAGMLALNPWHLQTSRLGHEATLSPLLAMASLAALLWANMPFDDQEQRQSRPLIAALAGAVVGISCYGYFAARLFLPIFLVGAVLVTWRAWRDRLTTQEGTLAVAALAIAVTFTFGPLLWKHLTDPEISKRARTIGWVWSESDNLSDRIVKVLNRYLGHFGLDFLFVNGDRNPALSPLTDTGLFQWYDLPVMVVGLIVCLSRARSSRAAGLLLLWIIIYPVSDLLTGHASSNLLRSLPGLCGLVLLAAVGAVSTARWVWKLHQMIFGFSCATAILITVMSIRFLQQFYDAHPDKYEIFHVDRLQACDWLRPRFDEVDAVFWSGLAAHPYIYSLVCLRYDPRQWFRDVREVMPGPLPNGVYRNEDIYLRYGKMHFMYGDSSTAVLNELMHNGRPDRVIFMIFVGSPSHLQVEKLAPPVYEVRNPQGQPVWWIYDLRL